MTVLRCASTVYHSDDDMSVPLPPLFNEEQQLILQVMTWT